MRSAAVAVAIALFAAASPAAANGKFPAAGQLVVDPGDGAHIVVRATIGLLTTRDAGAHWDWICETAAHYGGSYDPPIALTGDGAILVGRLDGLSVAAPDSCAFATIDALAARNVADVSASRADPALGFALAVEGATSSAVWSAPDGVAWSALGAPLPAGFRGETLDVAPSDPMRVYVSGLHMVNGKLAGALARSDDGGGSWAISDLPGSDAGSAPYLAAIDPASPDVVYVRLDGAPGRLLVTKDGGMNWSTAFTGSGFLKAFALSPDGSTAAVGGDSDGIWRADTATLAFAKVSGVGARCLAWADAGLYACADHAIDGFTVGLSTDEGGSFATLLRLPCVRGPLACDDGTPVATLCPPLWPGIATQIGAMYCDADAGAGEGGGDAGALPDAGTGSGGQGGGPPPVDTAGCGCRAGSDDAGSPIGIALALAIAAARRRRPLSPRAPRTSPRGPSCSAPRRGAAP